MKKVTLFVLFCGVAISSFSQSLGYQDLALLFSKDDNSGTARFNSLSGAFGALGGDISAIGINPAGAAVFNTSLASFSVNSRNTSINTVYYNNSNTTKDNFFNFSQAGAVFVFDNYTNSDWRKFAFSFNYHTKKDFRNNFIASGNSGVGTFIEFPLDNANPKTQYTTANSQEFINTYGGDISEYNFAISGLYKNDLYVGLALNTYSIDFSQRATLKELNSDINNNTLDVNFYQENFTKGTGFSLNAGFIYKTSQNLRLGLAYQTPIWFTEIIESTNILDNDGFLGDTEIVASNSNVIYDNTSGNYFPTQAFQYKLKTPGKLTASLAYIFGSNGLLSVDYAYKNYQNMKLSNAADFVNENQFFSNDLRNTYTINAGTEWRFNNLSIRGGYHYEQSPDKNAISSDNIKGFSFGGGYKFGHTTLDFSYQDSSHSELYNFYPQYNQVNPSELKISNQIITATLTINL